MVKRSIGVTIAVSLVVIACGSPTPSPRGAQPGGALQRGKALGPLHVRALREFVPSSSGVIINISAWAHSVAWAQAPNADALTQAIIAYDMGTGTSRVVARAKAGREVDFPVGSGTQLAYIDATGAKSDSDTNVSWTIVVVDLARGGSRVIASGGPTYTFFVPHPVMDSGVLAWVELIPGVSKDAADVTRIVAYDLASRRTSVLVEHGNPAAVSLVGGNAYYTGDSPGKGRDVFRVSLNDRLPPTQVTRSGQVGDARAHASVLCWEEPVTGQSKSLWILPLGTATTPTRVDNQNDGNVVAGGNFVLWDSLDGHLMIRDAAPSGPAAVLAQASELYLPARWAATDSLAVWATVRNIADLNAVPRIHIAEVSVGS